MNKKWFPITAVILLFSSMGYAQSVIQSHEELLTATQAHISDLNKKMETLGSPNPYEEKCNATCLAGTCDKKACDANTQTYDHQLQKAKRIQEQIRHEINSYIKDSVDPTKVDPKVIEENLLRILNQKTAESGEPRELCPDGCVLTVDLPEKKGLIITYRTEGIDLAHIGTTIQFYKAVNNRLVPAMTIAGGDMDSSDIYIRKLPSPKIDEMWFIVGGRKNDANGFGDLPIKIYTYNGDTLRTVWVSPPFIGMGIDVTHQGFTIGYLEASEDKNCLPPCWYSSENEYVLHPDGPHLLKARHRFEKIE